MANMIRPSLKFSVLDAHLKETLEIILHTILFNRLGLGESDPPIREELLGFLFFRCPNETIRNEVTNRVEQAIAKYAKHPQHRQIIMRVLLHTGKENTFAEQWSLEAQILNQESLAQSQYSITDPSENVPRIILDLVGQLNDPLQKVPPMCKHKISLDGEDESLFSQFLGLFRPS
eukprot:gnl/Trimastix_PCT/4436.p1 GENE.gnl/Trimastix_PCT/4436~~gnl/Trimastix_PCT/4436.p1  ORF type:complete len:200 (+),score=10.30 gnl/Trimastix_PCT/4436:76-600(+)